jgi:ATP-dependent DNA helicase PIF1
MFRVGLELTLKVGAQVMFMKNNGFMYRNGTRGVVESFVKDKDGKPVGVEVRTEQGVRIQVTETDFEFTRQGKTIVTRRVIPLNLAWALTIHKAQGMTITNWLQIDLSRVFGDGQAYVAFSRAVSMDKLIVYGFSKEVVKCNPIVKAYYDELESRDR